MKKTILCLCALTGLAACTVDDDFSGDFLHDGNREVEIAASVTRAVNAAGDSIIYDLLTSDYGKIYIRHTRDSVFKSKVDSTHTENDSLYTYTVQVTGHLTTGEGKWYWDGDTKHLFNAWTMPTKDKDQSKSASASGDSLVTLEAGKRYGTVNLAMDTAYENGERNSTRLSNLEYFIGTVKGPLNMKENKGTRVTLDFKHLVAKIIVKNILHIKGDGQTVTLGKDSVVHFSMPDMPNKAYWTTGIPDSFDPESTQGTLPHILPLDTTINGQPYKIDDEENEEDFGVDGSLMKTSEEDTVVGCFYIYPSDDDNLWKERGEIEFTYGGHTFYGTLASLTQVGHLSAGECIMLSLMLKEGKVGGLYPHIVDWSTGSQTVDQHDKPGIYSVDDWKRYIDWVNSNDGSDPPAGLFDADGNLNLYCDLDLSSLEEQYKKPSSLKFPDKEGEGKGKLKGNGHRMKIGGDETNWSDLSEHLDDIYVGGANPKYYKDGKEADREETEGE